MTKVSLVRSLFGEIASPLAALGHEENYLNVLVSICLNPRRHRSPGRPGTTGTRPNRCTEEMAGVRLCAPGSSCPFLAVPFSRHLGKGCDGQSNAKSPSLTQASLACGRDGSYSADGPSSGLCDCMYGGKECSRRHSRADGSTLRTQQV